MAALDEVTMDDVGSAEDTLQRLIHERKTLETAVHVLKTYRMVKSQLQPLLQTLQEAEVAIGRSKAELKQLDSERQSKIAEIALQLAKYKEAETKRVQETVVHLQGKLDKVEIEYTDAVAKLKAVQANQDQVMKYHLDQLAKVQSETEALKKEHAVLAEAVRKAATYFEVK